RAPLHPHARRAIDCALLQAIEIMRDAQHAMGVNTAQIGPDQRLRPFRGKRRRHACLLKQLGNEFCERGACDADFFGQTFSLLERHGRTCSGHPRPCLSGIQAMDTRVGRELRRAENPYFNRFAASSTMLRSACFFTSSDDFTKPRSRVMSTFFCKAPRSGSMLGS